MLENVLIDRRVVNTAHHSQHPVYQFERIGYFCLDTNNCSDQVQVGQYKLMSCILYTVGTIW